MERTVSQRLQNRLFGRLVLLHTLQGLVFSVTGIIDCAVVGRFVGTQGLAGMKLAMPVFSVLEIFALGLSSGFSVCVTKHLADGEREKARQTFLWTLLMILAVFAVMAALALAFPGAVTGFFAGLAGDASVRRELEGYVLPILIGSLPVLAHALLSAKAMLDGDARRISYALAAVLVTDAAGDLAAVLLHAGIRGIAWASVAAYAAGCAVLALGPGKKDSFLGPVRFRMDRSVPLGILTSGRPTAVRSLCMLLCPMAVNQFMVRWGTVPGLAALSIQDAVRYLPYAFCLGISSAALLLTGMYFAERNVPALREERKDILRCSLLTGSAVALVLALAAPLIIRLFTADPELTSLGTEAFRWYLLGIPFLGLNLTVPSYLTSVGKRRAASLFSLFHQLIVPVAVTAVLGRLFGIRGIYASFPACEVLSLLGYTAAETVSAKFRSAGKDDGEGDGILAEVQGSPRTLEDVTDASREVIRLCGEYGVSPRQAARVGLCLEELGANSIQHGFRGRKGGSLEYRFVISERTLILRLRDNGRPYDLTEQYRLLKPDDPTVHPGLRIVFADADDVGYSHAFDLNNVCIRMAREQETA